MSEDHFVNGGRRRAGFWRRMYLKAKIRHEIEKRVAAEIERIAPNDGLYLAK